MSADNVHFSSKSDEWETPQELFNKYDAIYNFQFDVAANKENSKCLNYYNIEDNGLTMPWGIMGTSAWCNPPYSNVKIWIKKAYEESLKGVTTVILIPARTDTIAWHEYIFPYAKIKFLKGRLRFSNSKNNAPFPSAIVIFDGRNSYDN